MSTSWVIREKATNAVVMETFDRAKVAALNTEKYEAVPILEYLGALNWCADGKTKRAACPNAACRWSGRCNIVIGEEGRHR